MPPERRLAFAVLIQSLQDCRRGVRVDLAGLLPWASMAEIPLEALVETLELAAGGQFRVFQSLGGSSNFTTQLADRRKRRQAAVEVCKAVTA